VGILKWMTWLQWFLSPGAEYMNMLVVGGMCGGIIGIEVSWGGGGIANPPDNPMGEYVAVVRKSILDVFRFTDWQSHLAHSLDNTD